MLEVYQFNHLKVSVRQGKVWLIISWAACSYHWDSILSSLVALLDP